MSTLKAFVRDFTAVFSFAVLTGLALCAATPTRADQLLYTLSESNGPNSLQVQIWVTSTNPNYFTCTAAGLPWSIPGNNVQWAVEINPGTGQDAHSVIATGWLNHSGNPPKTLTFTINSIDGYPAASAPLHGQYSCRFVCSNNPLFGPGGIPWDSDWVTYTFP